MSGDQAPLEMHLVHQAADGEFAVLGVMIVEGLGNAAFQKVLDQMPHQEGLSPTAGTIQRPGTPARQLRALRLRRLVHHATLHRRREVAGTPPPYRGVPPQIAAFRTMDFLHHDDDFIGNARPVQPLNGRLSVTPPPAPARITAPSTGDGGLR